MIVILLYSEGVQLKYLFFFYIREREKKKQNKKKKEPEIHTPLLMQLKKTEIQTGMTPNFPKTFHTESFFFTAGWTNIKTVTKK